MNADAATPTAPAAPVAPQPPAPVPGPGATTPPDQGHHKPAEPNALLKGAQTLWANLKAGKIGSPKLWLVLLLVAGVVFLWWFLANQSKNSTSALWLLSGTARPDVTGQEEFRKLPTVANTVPFTISELNTVRLRRDTAKSKMFGVSAAGTQAERQAAADQLEKLRDEFVKAADLFPKDRTLKSAALLDAADVELALIGIPKAGTNFTVIKDNTISFEVQPNSRGQVDRYAELLRKAAEVIGKETETGKGIIATADKYADKEKAKKLYDELGTLHVKFNNPDFVAPKPADKIPPTGGTGDLPGGGELPKTPVVVPPNPTDPKPGPTDAPKPPVEVPPNK